MENSSAENLRARAAAAARRGDLGEAKSLYRDLLRDHPSSAAAAEARQYLGAGAKPAGDRAPAERPAPTIQEVRIVGIDVGLWQLVLLFTRSAIAIVPALIFAAIIWSFVIALLGGGLGTLGAGL